MRSGGLVLAVLCAGCRLGFEAAAVDAGGDGDAHIGSKGVDAGPTCAPARLWSTTGTMSDLAETGATATVAYRGDDGQPYIIGIDDEGAMGLPVHVKGGGDAPRLDSAGGDTTVCTWSPQDTGWDLIYTSSVRWPGGMQSPIESRTWTGYHSTACTLGRRDDQTLLAYRREHPASSTYELVLEIYDATWMLETREVRDLSLGHPRQLIATASGFLLRTGDRLLPIDDAAMPGAPGVATSGFDHVMLVGGPQPASAVLLRTSAGAIEWATLNDDGTVRSTEVIRDETDVIDAVAATHVAEGQALLAWRTGTTVHVARFEDGALATPVLVDLGADATGAVEIATVAGGVLVAAEADDQLIAARVCP